MELHNPSFQLYPVNSNTTAWRPISLPIILIVPHSFDHDGNIINSQVWHTRIYIESVPQIAKIAGHQHIGMRHPDRDLYSLTISIQDLADRRLELMAVTIRHNGTPVEPEAAVDGDLIEYTTITGIRGELVFIQGAEYYDLSGIAIETEQLPSDNYYLVFETTYHPRLMSKETPDELLCIDLNHESIALHKFKFQHPGAVLDEFYQLTPSIHLTSATKALDTTVAFYRPFTEVLQDLADEQDVLKRINWIYSAPPEVLPYISCLLGWDLPYFPESFDQMRRAVLRRTVEFQTYKGSRKAIVSLFRTFGFEILISNLWWALDGSRFIRPNETLPTTYHGQEITLTNRTQLDLLLRNWTTAGFNQFSIPLLHRPQELAGTSGFSAVREGGNLTVTAFLVTTGSAAAQELESLAATVAAAPDSYNGTLTTDNIGFITAAALDAVLAANPVLGYSQVLISGKLGLATEQVMVGDYPPFVKQNCRLDREANFLHLTYDGYLPAGTTLYAFATYKRQQLTVPSELQQSNRFDVQILLKDQDELVDPITLEFVREFIVRIKAFHSQLNVIRHRIELVEDYEVGDLLIGGNIQQRYDTDIGRLQVPPAILPRIPTSIDACTNLDPTSLGYKATDILLRQQKLTALVEEHGAYRALDERTTTQTGALQLPVPTSDRTICRFNPYGQDRVVGGPVTAEGIMHHPSPTTSGGYSPFKESVLGAYGPTGPGATTNSDRGAYGSFVREHYAPRQPQCELDRTTDYIYAGRIGDELLHRTTQSNDEVVAPSACQLSLGRGVYWTYPAPSSRVVKGVAKPHSRTGHNLYSGGTNNTGQTPQSIGAQRLAGTLPGILGNNYHHLTARAVTLHFADTVRTTMGLQQHNLALQRPSLGIVKSTLHFPGCRFPSMYALATEFTHPVWTARPWDYSRYCGPTALCGTEPVPLNAALVTLANGDTSLIYDTVPYSLTGNGLLPDLTLDNHELVTGVGYTEADVVHQIYAEGAAARPAVTLDNLCVIPTETIAVAQPRFHSDVDGADYTDGYPCSTGFLAYTASDWERTWLSLDTITPTEFLFFLGSGISTGQRDYRLDCNCLVVDQDSDCGSIYDDADGVRDWNPAQVQTVQRLAPDDSLGIAAINLDGAIPSLLELV